MEGGQLGKKAQQHADMPVLLPSLPLRFADVSDIPNSTEIQLILRHVDGHGADASVGCSSVYCTCTKQACAINIAHPVHPCWEDLRREFLQPDGSIS